MHVNTSSELTENFGVEYICIFLPVDKMVCSESKTQVCFNHFKVKMADRILMSINQSWLIIKALKTKTMPD
jgi:hypothetical protein